MADAKPQPPPWEGGPIPDEPDTCVFGCRGLLFGRVVGSPGHPAEDTLGLLLRAANSHAALVAALAACELAMDTAAHHGVGDILPPAYRDSWAAAHEAARVALAKGGK